MCAHSLFRYKTILFKKRKEKVVHQHQQAEMTRVSSQRGELWEFFRRREWKKVQRHLVRRFEWKTFLLAGRQCLLSGQLQDDWVFGVFWVSSKNLSSCLVTVLKWLLNSENCHRTLNCGISSYRCWDTPRTQPHFPLNSTSSWTFHNRSFKIKLNDGWLRKFPF